MSADVSSPADGATREGLPIATGRETWRVVWATSRGHRAKLVAVGVLGLASAGIALIPPLAIGQLVDRVQTGTADLGTILIVTAIIAVAAIAGAAGTAATIVLAARSYHTMVADLRERLVEHAMTLPQGVIERAGTGDLVSRSSDDVNEIADAAPLVIPAFTTTAFAIIATFGGLAALEWPYVVALAVTLPVYVLTLRWYLRTGPRVYRAERTAMSARAQSILESQRGYATILGFGLGQQRHRSVLAASWAVARYTLRARVVQNMFFARLNVAECAGLAAILVTGFVLIRFGGSTVGAATAAMLLILALFGPINQLLFVVDSLQSALASLNRMVGVITVPVNAPPRHGSDETGRVQARPDAGASHAVRLDGIRFSYDGDRPALDGVELTILTGQRVAVVGPSGAGKTTLASVVAGIHQPHNGMVTRPHRTAVITQETHVFAGTFRENLIIAAPHVTDEEVHAALEATGAGSLVDLLPEGLDTVVGTTGHPLTAAQAQQLALARVVLADPDLAIFDEATAEAGSSHAEILDHAADAALRGRTGIVIAHRLSQAVTCDRIVVMESGRIVEDGTHNTLVNAGGVYAGLWAAWNGTSEGLQRPGPDGKPTEASGERPPPGPEVDPPT